MIRFWPLPVDIVGYSPAGLVLFAASAMLGFACGFALKRRSRPALLCLLAVGLFVLAASVHWATVLTLLRDPRRDLGSIPLQPPFDKAAVWAAIVLGLVSPGLATFIVTRVLVVSPRPQCVVRVAYFVVSIYAASVAPWALFAFFD